MNKPKCTPINAHVLKQLFEAVQMQNNDLNFNNREDFKELEIRISEFRFGISYKGAAITDKALLKYWGIDKYGIAGRRYTPNSIYLDVLADFCGYKNWNQFQKQSGFKIVNNVLSYEQKQTYFNEGIWYVDSAKTGDVIYFGDKYKYIAFQKTKFGLELFDFKNIHCFTTFTMNEIEGIEVIKKENQEISIRFIY